MSPESTSSEGSPSQFQISQEFIEKLLQKPVKSFEIKSGSLDGENYCSVLRTVHVILENGEDLAILIKSLPDHPARQFFIEQADFFKREYFVYNEMIPALIETVGKIDKLNIESVAFHGGNCPGEKGKFENSPWAKSTFIVMTDLRHKLGYSNTDRRGGLDFDHASLVMQALGTFHGFSWAYKQQNNLNLLTTKFPILEDFAFADSSKVGKNWPFVAPMFDQSVSICTEMVNDALGKSHPAVQGLSQLMSKGISNLLLKFLDKEGVNEDGVENLLRIKPGDDVAYNKDPWLVMAHGDCWSNNFLFKYDDPSDPSKPTGLKMVDFQFTRETCPTLDLAYLFLTSVRTKSRKAHEKELLQIYYNTICKVFAATSTEPLPGFTFENLLRRYRRAKIFGLIIALPLLNLILLAPEDADNLDEKEACGNISEVFSGTIEKGMKNAALTSELVDLVLDLYEEGVL